MLQCRAGCISTNPPPSHRLQTQAPRQLHLPPLPPALALGRSLCCPPSGGQAPAPINQRPLRGLPPVAPVVRSALSRRHSLWLAHSAPATALPSAAASGMSLASGAGARVAHCFSRPTSALLRWPRPLGAGCGLPQPSRFALAWSASPSAPSLSRARSGHRLRLRGASPLLALRAGRNGPCSARALRVAALRSRRRRCASPLALSGRRLRACGPSLLPLAPHCPVAGLARSTSKGSGAGVVARGFSPFRLVPPLGAGGPSCRFAALRRHAQKNQR
jgi:hypothetical protein